MTYALEIDGITKCYSDKSGGKLAALKGISLGIEQGKCLGLIGESGSGKSTLAKIIGGIILPTGGSVYFYGKKLPFRGAEVMKSREGMQMLFQNAFSSFNPYMRMSQALSEGICYREKVSFMERKSRIFSALEEVGLDPELFYNKRPDEMSGGECQRAAIARALLCKPKLLICDEITSALDVSIQAQIVKMLVELQKEKGLTLLFISHDIALVSCIADTMAILHSGELVEMGKTHRILTAPSKSYTEKLLRFAKINEGMK